MTKGINNYSEFLVCEIINYEPTYGNFLYQKIIGFLDIKRITVYKILERLVEKNIIEIINPNEKKKYYQLTTLGIEYLEDAKQMYPSVILDEYIEIGSNIIKLETIDSTTSFIKLNADSLKDGDVVIANRQLTKRTRDGVVIDSTEETLEFSFLMKPKYDFEKSLFIDKITIASLIKTLEGYNVNATLKLLSELYVDSKAIATVDVECTNYKVADSFIVVTVSVNVNNERFEDVDEHTSIYLESNSVTNLTSFVQLFFQYFNEFHKEMIVGKFHNFIKVIKENSDVIGKNVVKNNCSCKVINITENGNLVVACNGKIDVTLPGTLNEII